MSEESSQRVTVEFALKVGDRQMKAQLEVPSGQTNITELLPIIQSFENSIIGHVASQAGEVGLAISCKAGCGACCRQMVPVSIFEAEALAHWIRSLPPEQQQAIEARFHQSLTALSKSGIINRLVEEDWLADHETSTNMAIDYFRLGVPCPFLIDESCSIHPMRPLSCREYLVTSPPELCRDPATNTVSGVHLPFKLSHALYRLGSDLEHDRRGWIPLVFLFAWMRSGAQPGQAYSGTGQEVLHTFIKRLAPDQPHHNLPPDPHDTGQKNPVDSRESGI
jgi:Fe-S-cluster containining protein